jgi:hypothetical protein
MAGGRGATVTLPERRTVPVHAYLFGEDQARYVLTASAGEAAHILVEAAMAGVPATMIGAVGGATLSIGDCLAISVETLAEAHENWFPRYMSAA